MVLCDKHNTHSNTCAVMLETVYVWSPSVKRFIVLCENALVKLQHRIFITSKINRFPVETCQMKWHPFYRGSVIANGLGPGRVLNFELGTDVRPEVSNTTL